MLAALRHLNSLGTRGTLLSLAGAICFFVDSFNVAHSRTVEEEIVVAQKALFMAIVLRQKTEGSRLEGLEFEQLEVPVFLIPQKDSSYRPLVELRALYDRPDWEIVVGGRPPLRDKRNPSVHRIYAYLNSRVNEVEIQARGPSGKMMSEKIYIFAPEAREFKMVTPYDAILLSVGIGQLIYDQTSFGRFASQTLTLGAHYLSPEKGKKWGQMADFNMTLYTVNSSPIQTNPHVLEGRAGFTHSARIFRNQRWRSRAFAGVSGVSLVSQGSPFGFSGLYSGTLGLRNEYFYRGDRSYVASIFYSPYELTDPLSERGFELQGAWKMGVGEFRRGELVLRYSNHKFSKGFENITSQIISLSFGFSI